MQDKNFILIDGHALAYRSYFALERTGMKTSDKQPTWAVFGFFKAVFDLLKNFHDIRLFRVAGSGLQRQGMARKIVHGVLQFHEFDQDGQVFAAAGIKIRQQYFQDLDMVVRIKGVERDHRFAVTVFHPNFSVFLLLHFIPAGRRLSQEILRPGRRGFSWRAVSRPLCFCTKAGTLAVKRRSETVAAAAHQDQDPQNAAASVAVVIASAAAVAETEIVAGPATQKQQDNDPAAVVAAEAGTVVGTGIVASAVCS